MSLEVWLALSHASFSMDPAERPGEDLTVDLAIEKLSDSLRDAEYAIPVTHGRTFTWRRCAFQAHASPAQFPRDVQYVVDKLAAEKPWRMGRYTPCGKLQAEVVESLRNTSWTPLLLLFAVDS